MFHNLFSRFADFILFIVEGNNLNKPTAWGAPIGSVRSEQIHKVVREA